KADEQKQKDSPKKPKGKFTIGKDTTYVTGPIDKDGYVDYAAALNERLGKGVTPENNANVLLWKAFGPRPEGKPMPAEFFRLLGIDPPPEKGDYFVDYSRYLKEQLRIDPADEEESVQDQLWRTRERPWKTKDYPNVASWLKANEKPLAVVIEATKRTNYFSPLVVAKTDKGPSDLIAAPMPGVQQCPELANALAARAMLRASQRAVNDAWQDLLACHRLGRLVGRGANLVEGLVGYAIDNTACKADLAFLDSTKPDAKQIERCLRDLQNLPPLPSPAEVLDLGERFLFLDSLMLIARYGVDYLEGLSATKGQKPASPDVKQWRAEDVISIDWDQALRKGNRWYDRLLAAAREKDRNSRKEKAEQIEADLKALKKNFVDKGRFAGLLFGDAG